MNAFERKMAEKVALISTLIIDINSRTTAFNALMDFDGRTNHLGIRFNEYPEKPFPKILGNKRVYYILRLEAYLDPANEEAPFHGCCTTDHIIHVLQQTRQALIEGRTDEITNHSGNDSATASATGLDQRYGTDGELPTEGTEVCYGAPVGTGQQQPGALPAMA